jgi:hypothetical protein
MNTRAWVLILVCALCSAQLWAADFYVSPNGAAAGNGSITNPWDLQTALNHPPTIHAGDTIWLRGGRYFYTGLLSRIGQPNVTALFQSKLQGTAAAPIIVRGYTGERAIIDGNIAASPIKNIGIVAQSAGGYVTYRDFEITNSDPNGRLLTQLFFDNSNTPVRRGNSIDFRASGIKIINTVIYDTGQGIGSWQQAPDFEAYGNVIFNNGWDAPDRAHGHGVYTQNDTGAKLFKHNIFGSGFELSFKAAGTSASQIKNFTIAQNALYGVGMLLGGNGPVDNLLFDGNYNYKMPVTLGYGGTQNNAATLTNNYMGGGYSIDNFTTVTLSHNVVFYNDPFALGVLKVTSAWQPSANSFANNSYYRSFQAFPYWCFNIMNANSNISQLKGLYAFNKTQGTQAQTYNYTHRSWQDDLGLDMTSTFSDAAPAGVKTFVNPNQYDPDRAMIVIYNFDHNNSVNADISALNWPAGSVYELHNSQDYFGDVVTGVYNGGSTLMIPMTGHTVSKPLGYDPLWTWYHFRPLSSFFPEYGAFSLIRRNNTGVLPPVIQSFSGSAAKIPPGQSSTLSWIVSGATSISIDNSIGAVPASGAHTVSPGAPTAYTLTASNAVGSVSAVVVVNVSSPPVITIQPANQTVLVGQNATFIAAASGTSPIFYQWRLNGVNISGATSTKYQTPVTTVADNGSIYDVVIWNSEGSVTSGTAVLTVTGTSIPPSITTQPANQTVAVGQTATFTVIANGAPAPTYQWQNGTTNIVGATNYTYTIPSTTMVDNGTIYRCVVTNATGSVTSNTATLTVNGIAPTISTQPINQTVTVGQTTTFTVVASGNPAPTYQWQKGTVNIAGATSASHTTPATTIADNGTIYHCVVTNPTGSVTSSAATLTVNGIAPIINAQPNNQTVPVGQTAAFTIVASGNPAPTYQWQRGTANISSATSASYTTPVTTMADNGATYRCVVTNAAGSVTSNAATLTVNGVAPTITTQPVNKTVAAAQTATFSVMVSGAPAPTYQWQKGAINISGAITASYTIPATTMADNGATYRCVVTNSAGVVISNAATLTVTNTAPVISSRAFANPNPATVGQSVAFSVAAKDVNGDTLTYAWTLGDGSSATVASVNHAYTAAGSFTATVLVSDPYGGKVTSSAPIIVNPRTGTGTNSGTGTNTGTGTGTSTGTGTGTVTVTGIGIGTGTSTGTGTGGGIRFKLKTMTGVLSKGGGRDSTSLAGTIPNLPALFDPSNAALTLNVGGATGSFALDAHGRARNDRGSFALRLKFSRTKGVSKRFFAGGDATFIARLTNGSWAAVWVATGMDVNATMKNASETVPVRVTLNGSIYQIPASVLYSAKSGKGSFKLSNGAR